MAYFLRNLEPTEAGKRLQLDEETIKNTMLVYRLCDDKWIYRGPYFEKQELEEDDIVVPVTSSYSKTIKVAKGEPFANVIGSTRDPRPRVGGAKSWIHLVQCGIIDYEYTHNGKSLVEANEIALQEINECCMMPYFYRDYVNARQVSREITCSVNEPGKPSNIVGGHVIEGEVNKILSAGANLRLMPICKCHNSGIWCDSNKYFVHGGLYYMITKRDTYAVVLENYLQCDRIYQHMKNNPIERL